MIFLNLGCGYPRPKFPPWVNVDMFSGMFSQDSPEWENLSREHNYIDANITNPLPFKSASVDGVLLSHVLEHMSCLAALDLMMECRRVLRYGGVLRVSTPDPSRFHRESEAGRSDWGEPITVNRFDEPTDDFMDYALFYRHHVQLLGRDSLFCLFRVSGFSEYKEKEYQDSSLLYLGKLDNRPLFSCFVEGTK